MSRKHVIIVPDGAADSPLEMFDNQTVIEAADTPAIDWISINGMQGLSCNVPKGLTPGSDVAMMSLLGYDPKKYYTGRAPIEAVAMGIGMKQDDWIFRCNLVTIADADMADHSAGHISQKEANILMNDIGEQLGSKNIKFYPGVSYRNLCLIKGQDFNVKTRPPHDMIGEAVDKNLPKGKNAEMLVELMAKSQQLLSQHEVNRVRQDLGENPVSSIWLWGQGQQAFLDKFSKRFGLKGSTITAVDLVRGLSKLIGFGLIQVEGATGYADTNYSGKATAAIEALETNDIVLVHVEAPDEAGHSGNAKLKKQAIESMDHLIVKPVLDALKKYDDWRILVMPDHPTPVMTRAHSSEPVPFAMAGTDINGVMNAKFSEANSRKTGFVIEQGHTLMEYFLKK